MLRRYIIRWALLLAAIPGCQPAAATGFTFPLDFEDDDHRYRVSTVLRLDDRVSWQTVVTILENPAGWCRLSLLVPDVRGCTVRPGPDTEIVLRVQSTEDRQPRSLSHRFQTRNDTEILTASMRADRGPLGITDAGLMVSARRTPDGVVLKLAYGYRSSFRSRIATGAYVASTGRDRPGISYRELPDGSREYVTGTRALLERNAMRYFLAVAAVLESTDTASAIIVWYDAAASFTADLPEQDRDSYIRERRTLLGAD